MSECQENPMLSIPLDFVLEYLVDSCDREELIQFVKDLSEKMGDYELDSELSDFFEDALSEYSVDSESLEDCCGEDDCEHEEDEEECCGEDDCEHEEDDEGCGEICEEGCLEYADCKYYDYDD